MSDAIASPPVAYRRPAWPLLGLTTLVVAAVAMILFAPDLPRRLLTGPASVPPPLGEAPDAIGAVGGDLAERQPRADWSAIGRTHADTLIAPISSPEAKTRTPVGTAQAPVDDAKAVELLAEAEQRYATMDWDRASSLAGRIAGMPSHPAVAQRADGVARGAVALKRLFRELDDRDELNRNWDTHPSLLALERDGRTDLLVPLVSLDDPVVAVPDEPLAWAERLRATGKAGCFLLKSGSSFTKAEIVPGAGTMIRVDQQALAVQLGRQLDRTIARITGDADMRDDPNAWYEAGKFAFRNRLDTRVTALLDRAFRLDPDLAATVREGNAGALFGALVGHMKNGSKQQAAVFMAAIERRYADTRQAKLARLYYRGLTAELVTAAREPGPAAALPAVPPAAPAVAAAPPDLARARQLCADGSKPFYQAMGMPATDERNRLYHQAAAVLRQAKLAYAQWCEAHPEDATAGAEGLEASNMEVAARKYGTL